MLCCTMLVNEEEKKTKLPPLGFHHSAGKAPSHCHKQHAQKLVKITRVVLEKCPRTDRQTDRQTDTHTRHYVDLATIVSGTTRNLE